MKKALISLLFTGTSVFGQPAIYTIGNAHSHNDYQQATPLVSAYNLQFGSIEADVYLNDSELLVARTQRDAMQHRTLEELYLKPLSEFINNNGGHVYPDSSRSLVLMLDVKTEAISTINKLIDILIKYPVITKCPSLTILLTGSKPDPSAYISYPSYLWFDGLLSNRYSKEALARIAVLDDNFINYTKWNGNGDLPPGDFEKLKKLVEKGHALGKRVRFWNAPDIQEGWVKQMELGVDFINTDSIKALAEFLKKK